MEQALTQLDVKILFDDFTYHAVTGVVFFTINVSHLPS